MQGTKYEAGFKVRGTGYEVNQGAARTSYPVPRTCFGPSQTFNRLFKLKS
jgi:hypothetical protein